MQKLSRKAWIWIIVIVALTGTAGYLLFTGVFNRDSRLVTTLTANTTPLHVAVIIPEKEQDSHPEIEQTARMFENETNSRGGVNGHPLKIDFYYDGHDSVDEAILQAKQVVADNRALVVIGHRKSPASAAIAPIYEAAHIPNINTTASAPEVTQNHPWAFRVMSNTTDLGKYAALYAREVMKYDSASIIYTDDNFGYSSAASIKATFEGRGGKIVYEQKIARLTVVDEAGLNKAKEIVQALTLPNAPKPGIVFLALSKNEAKAFVLAMRASKQNFPLLASYGMGDIHFAPMFDNPSDIDGMTAMTILSYDVAGERAQVFYDDYSNQYKQPPSWLGATTYDALHVAVMALEKADITGISDHIGKERQKIRDYLETINNPNDGIDGLTGSIYFDQNHNFTQPTIFVTYQEGNMIAAPIQLHPIPDKRLIPDLNKVLADGLVIFNEQKYFYKTNVVYTGIKLNDISNVDIDQSHTFAADFYLWFRYQGDLDVEAIEFINATEPFKLETPVSAYSFQNINYRLYRVHARFRVNVDLQNYPYDSQELAIQFRHSSLTREKLIYVEDALGMDKVTSGDTLISHLNTDNVFANVSDWVPTDGHVYIDTYSNKASLGNPVWIGIPQSVENSRFNIKIEIQRKSARFAFKNMFPLFCLLLLAYLSLFLPGQNFEAITSIMTGTMLSVVFFHVSLSSRLNVGYSVALDYVFFAIYLLLILELLIGVVAWHHKGDEKLALRLMRWARITFPIYIVTIGVLFIWLYTDPKGLLVLGYLKAHIPGL